MELCPNRPFVKKKIVSNLIFLEWTGCFPNYQRFMEDTYLSALIIDSWLIESRFEMIARSGPIIRLFKLSLEFQSLIQMDTGSCVVCTFIKGKSWSMSYLATVWASSLLHGMAEQVVAITRIAMKKRVVFPIVKIAFSLS